MTPCSGRKCARPIATWSSRAEPTRCARCIRTSGYTPSGNISRNAFARDAGLRIDHLLLSPAAAGRLVAAGVDRDVRARERSSDHAPVWIELTDADAVAGRRRPVVSASSVIGCRSAGGAGTGSNREKPLLMGYASAAVLPRTGRACARLAGLTHQSEMTEMLERVAEDFEDMPYDLETGAVDVRHPELLPQLRRDGKR